MGPEAGHIPVQAAGSTPDQEGGLIQDPAEEITQVRVGVPTPGLVAGCILGLAVGHTQGQGADSTRDLVAGYMLGLVVAHIPDQAGVYTAGRVPLTVATGLRELY